MSRAITRTENAIDAEFVEDSAPQAYPCGFCGRGFPAAELAGHIAACPQAPTQQRAPAPRGTETEDDTPSAERDFREGMAILEDAQEFSRSLKRPRNRMHKAHQDGQKVGRFFANIFFPKKPRE